MTFYQSMKRRKPSGPERRSSYLPNTSRAEPNQVNGSDVALEETGQQEGDIVPGKIVMISKESTSAAGHVQALPTSVVRESFHRRAGIREVMDASGAYKLRTVEIKRNRNESVGFYIRQGDGWKCKDGIFVSRVNLGSVVDVNDLLHVGEEIVKVNGVDITKLKLNDAVPLIQKKRNTLRLTIKLPTSEALVRTLRKQSVPVLQEESTDPLSDISVQIASTPESNRPHSSIWQDDDGPLDSIGDIEISPILVRAFSSTTEDSLIESRSSVSDTDSPGWSLHERPSEVIQPGNETTSVGSVLDVADSDTDSISSSPPPPPPTSPLPDVSDSNPSSASSSPLVKPLRDSNLPSSNPSPQINKPLSSSPPQHRMKEGTPSKLKSSLSKLSNLYPSSTDSSPPAAMRLKSSLPDASASSSSDIELTDSLKDLLDPLEYGEDEVDYPATQLTHMTLTTLNPPQKESSESLQAHHSSDPIPNSPSLSHPPSPCTSLPSSNPPSPPSSLPPSPPTSPPPPVTSYQSPPHPLHPSTSPHTSKHLYHSPLLTFSGLHTQTPQSLDPQPHLPTPPDSLPPSHTPTPSTHPPIHSHRLPTTPPHHHSSPTSLPPTPPLSPPPPLPTSPRPAQLYEFKPLTPITPRYQARSPVGSSPRRNQFSRDNKLQQKEINEHLRHYLTHYGQASVDKLTSI